MDEILTRITGLGSTRDNVVRDRPYPVSKNTVCALSLYQAGEIPSDETENWPNIDMDLEFNIDIYARESSDYPITQQLNQIAKEVIVGISAIDSPPLGLGFCIDLNERGRDAPDRESGEYPIARQRMTWEIKYRRSRLDPSQ